MKKGEVLAVLAILGSIVAANLLTAEFGLQQAIVNAFVLIGLDIVARDYLHDRWHSWWRMGLLVAAGALVAYLVNADARTVAIGSACAFAAAFTVDAFVYGGVRERPWLERANLSNIPTAAVDSIVFAAIVFGAFDFYAMAAITFAKIGGGAVWALALRPAVER